MAKWKRIDSGLYQRYDDGIPQNVFIDRVGYMSASGKTLMVEGWSQGRMVNGKLEATGDWWHTLREAKVALTDVRGFDDTQK